VTENLRTLSPEERATLDALLAVEFAGAAALREQAASAEVSGGCECGCPTIDFTVDPTTPRAHVRELVVSEAEVDQTDDSVLLFVRDGRLNRLEYVWIGDAPATFPPAERLRTRRA
jgi:hypothetical protein